MKQVDKYNVVLKHKVHGVDRVTLSQHKEDEGVYAVSTLRGVYIGLTWHAAAARYADEVRQAHNDPELIP